jgi:hypothetical protein
MTGIRVMPPELSRRHFPARDNRKNFHKDFADEDECTLTREEYMRERNREGE